MERRAVLPVGPSRPAQPAAGGRRHGSHLPRSRRRLGTPASAGTRGARHRARRRGLHVLMAVRSAGLWPASPQFSRWGCAARRNRTPPLSRLLSRSHDAAPPTRVSRSRAMPAGGRRSEPITALGRRTWNCPVSHWVSHPRSAIGGSESARTLTTALPSGRSRRSSTAPLATWCAPPAILMPGSLTTMRVATRLPSAFGRAALSRSVETMFSPGRLFCFRSCTSSIWTNPGPPGIQVTRTSSWVARRYSNARPIGSTSGSTNWPKAFVRRRRRRWSFMEAPCWEDGVGGVDSPSRNAGERSGRLWKPPGLFAARGHSLGSQSRRPHSAERTSSSTPSSR